MITLKDYWIIFGVTLTLVSLITLADRTKEAQQSAGSSPSFEVASIKLDRSGRGGGSRTAPMTSEQFSATNVTVGSLIELAYKMLPFQVVGAPSWVDSERYDVDAKIDDALFAQLRGRPREEQMEQFRLMLRSLLADRFELRAIPKSDIRPSLEMVISKKGVRFGEAGLRPVAPFRNNPTGVVMVIGRGDDIKIQGMRATIDRLANSLSIALARQVTNNTGLKGNYDFLIQFADDTHGPPEVLPSETSIPLVFGALENALGLKLQRANGPVEVLVIDHIEKPSAN